MSTDDWRTAGLAFNPTHKYGIIDSADLIIEEYMIDARTFLVPGVPFAVLEFAKSHERAWFYSPDCRPPGNDGVSVIAWGIA